MLFESSATLRELHQEHCRLKDGFCTQRYKSQSDINWNPSSSRSTQQICTERKHLFATNEPWGAYLKVKSTLQILWNTPQSVKQISRTFLCSTWHFHGRWCHSPCVNPWPGSAEITDTNSFSRNTPSQWHWMAQLHLLDRKLLLLSGESTTTPSFLATAGRKSFRLSWKGGGSWGKTVIWSTLP